nr:MAG TPA: hypothetical protein [Caudoviricetes sp.]
MLHLFTSYILYSTSIVKLQVTTQVKISSVTLRNKKRHQFFNLVKIRFILYILS